MPVDPRFAARIRATFALGRGDQNARPAPPNHNIPYPAVTETNTPAVNNAATYTAVLPGDTSEDDVVYEAADEGAVALADVHNGTLESNGASTSHYDIDYPEFPSVRGEAEIRNGLNLSFGDDDESEAANEPEGSVSAVLNSRAIEEEERRPTRKTRTKKGRKPAGPAQAKKGKGKERATNTGPSDEAHDMPTRSAGNVEKAIIPPPEVTRPRTRAAVRAEEAAAAAAAATAAATSRQVEAKDRAVEPIPPPPSNNVTTRRGRGKNTKKVASDDVANAVHPEDAAPAPSRRRARGVQCTVKLRSPSPPPPPPLVVPDGMRKLRRGRLVPTEPPVRRTRARRQQSKTVPAVKEETAEEKKKEQPKRESKRTRDEFEGDDVPEDAPPRKRSKYNHTPADGAVATPSGYTFEQIAESLVEETADAEPNAPASPVIPPEEEDVAPIVPEGEVAEIEVEAAELAAPEVPAVEAPAQEEAAAPPAVAAPQLPAHLAQLPPAFLHAAPNQQHPQGLVPVPVAANHQHRPLRRSETTLLFGKIYRR